MSEACLSAGYLHLVRAINCFLSGIGPIVDRSKIKEGFFQTMADEAEALGLLKPMAEHERKASRAETLAARPAGAAIWVFAYGSLMWNPAFHFAEQKLCRLFGYHRSFCLETPIGRGSPDCTGLVLGLDRGGSVRGMAFRIEEDQAEEELDILWSREMLAGSYSPTWVRLYSDDHVPFHGIAFVMNRESDRYNGSLSREETIHKIAHACGSLGPCIEYLENTVAAMDNIGIVDGPMHQIRDEVRALKQQKDSVS